MYPLSKFNGRMQTMDWSKIPNFPSPAGGQEETRWVLPEKFFDELNDVLDEVPPLPGEERMYANIHAILDAPQKDPRLKAALVASATESEKNIVTPLFQFRNYGLPLPNNWTTQKMVPTSEPTTTPAQRLLSPTSSSTRKTRRSIFIILKGTWTPPPVVKVK
jgi:hypothetical protein